MHSNAQILSKKVGWMVEAGEMRLKPSSAVRDRFEGDEVPV
jgi:hypothetical protein